MSDELDHPHDLDGLDDRALDHLGFGVIGVDPAGTVTRYNQAEATRAGFARWRVLGRDLRELGEAMGAPDLAARVRRFAAEDTAAQELHCVVLTRRGRRDEARVVLRRGARAIYVCICAASTLAA